MVAEALVWAGHRPPTEQQLQGTGGVVSSKTRWLHTNRRCTNYSRSAGSEKWQFLGDDFSKQRV